MSQPSPDAKAVVRAAEALTTQVRRIADALSTPVVRYEVAADDGPTTPATTCSARYTGPQNPPTACIRAAQHEHPFHTDEKSWNWRDEVAVYPVDSGLVREAPADEDATCRHMETRTCPAIYNGPCGDRPCARFESDDPTPWLDPAEKPYAGATTPEAAPAADEEDAVAPTCWHTEADSPCDWDRCRQPERLAAGDQGTDPATTPPLGPQLRAADEEGAPNMLRVLADRSARGVLSPGEGDALRRRVEQLIAGRETWKTKAEEIERDRDQHAAVLTDALGRFTHDGAGGYQCLLAVPAHVFERWSSVVAPTTERPWWEQVREAQAAIERVRNYLAELEGAGWSQSAIARRIRAALDGTEQPTTEQPEPPAGNLAAYQAAIARVALVLREAREHREQTDPSERQDCVMCGADHFAEIRDAIKGKSITTEGP